jgi:hypothetical protein
MEKNVEPLVLAPIETAFEQPMMIFVIAELLRSLSQFERDKATLAILINLNTSRMIKH